MFNFFSGDQVSSPTSSIRTALRFGRTAAVALVTGALVAGPLQLLQSSSTPAVAAEPTPPLSVKVDMTNNASTAPVGYTADLGGAYTDAAGFGWVRQDSLAGTHVPFGVPLNTRDRNLCTNTTNVPTPQRTFIHMQAPVTNATNNSTPVAWEHKLPNGQYQVSVGVGDPNPGNDAESHVINVEGTKAVEGMGGTTSAACTAGRLRTTTVWVDVNDGKLTVDALGGTNTKLAFVTIDAIPVVDLTARAAAGGTTLSWDAASGVDGYRVWRGDNLPVDTSKPALATVTDPAYVDESATKGTISYYAVAPAGTGTPAAVSVTEGVMDDDATATRPELPKTFTFRSPTGTPPVPAGTTADTGLNYANARGYGWVAAGTQKPLSMPANGRVRPEAVPDPKLSGVMHMQWNNVASGTAGTPRPGAWQLAVADGSYDVELSVGDALPGGDVTSHTLTVEGKPAVTRFGVTAATTGAARFKSATLTDVAVTDGFLTVDPTGGVNTKINYITVTPTPSDKKPGQVTALTASAGDGKVTLGWTAPADDDLAGYRVYRSTTSTVDTTGTPLSGTDLVTGTAYTDASAANDTTYRYAVVAVDKAGQAGPTSDVSAAATPSAVEPVLTKLPVKINFVAADTTVATGFAKDFGQAYTNARGRGWVVPGTHTGLDLVGNGRFRDVRTGFDVPVRQRGVLHMQGNDVKPTFTGVAAPGAYELAVAEGTYDVTVSVGDQPGASSYDSKHSITVEGTKAVEQFQATAAAEFSTGTVRVEVTDGKLTVDATGGTNTKINYLDVVEADVTAPAAPTDLAVEAGDGRTALTWEAGTEPDLAGYRVYARTGTTVEPVAADRLTTTLLADPAFAHTGLVNGTAVSYLVTAVDREGNESKPSAVVTATPADTTAPAAPATLTATPGDARVTLRWTAPAAGDAVAYRVYRATSSPVGTTAAQRVGDDVTGTVFVDADRTNGTEVFYVVTALDAAGNESAASEEKSATPAPDADTTAPAAPQGVTAVPGDGRATISWTAGAETDLAGYLVTRSAVAGQPGTPVNTQPTTATSLVDTAALNGTTYYYVVRAVDLAGNLSEASAEVSAKPADTTAPAVPAGVKATAGIQSVTVTWTAGTEADLRGYRVYRSETPTVTRGDDDLVAILLKGGRTFFDGDLEAGRTYYYAVTADDRLGNESALSTTVSAVPKTTPDTTAPGAPTGLQAAVQDSEVKLTWSASTAGDLAGYTVYRASTAGGTAVKLTSALLTSPSFTDTSVPPGTTAFYEVTAVDDAGNESARSAQVPAAVAAPASDVRFVFQTDAAPVPAGHTKDTGAAYSTATKRGWVRQDSLASATHTPLDLTPNTRTRERPAPVTDLQNRLIHMTYGDVVGPTAPNVLTAGAWEYGVPNGRYAVTVSVGDQAGATTASCAAPCYDSRHTVRAEGVVVHDRFQATAAAEYATATATVDVLDGKLTLDAVGGTNTKMNWVRVVGIGAPLPDTTAPAAPSGLAGSASDASVALTWTAPDDTDVVGYNVYRATGTQTTVPVTVENRRNGSVLLTREAYTERELANGTAYTFVVTAVDAAGNESAPSTVRTLTPINTPASGTALKVDFTAVSTAPATGYLADWGQAYGLRTAATQGTGNTYGWVNLATDAPLDLSLNGRDRATAGGKESTLVHMQFTTTSATGTATPGKWEAAVPNGAYTVTVGVGDTGPSVDSTHWLNIENQNAVAAFTPTTGTKVLSATRTVQVTDGRLTLSPAGGTNTKVTYVDITGVDLGGRPYSTGVTPANLATKTAINVAPTTDNALNGDVGAVDATSLKGSVKLTRVSDGKAVPGSGATSGGGDTVTFKADGVLDPDTLYRFDITDQAKDVSGRQFMPFSSVFTTSNGLGGGDVNVAFERSESGAPTGAMYTSVVIGPDGKLYAGSIMGQIYRFTINADGTLANRETINTVREHATAKGWEGAPNRTIIGLTFDPASTATNPVLWITDNYAYLGQDVPNHSGAIAKLSGRNLETYTEVAVNLPRSIKDHETNSIAFRDGKLYITQGSMNAMGGNDGTWRRPENLMSAAVLELDPAKLPANLPVDVATKEMSVPARGGVPAHQGSYDPYAPGAPVTLYATGVRNAFDLVWHSNGHLYSGTNGSAAGGNVPATPATLPASCVNRPDGGYPADQKSPAITQNPQAETDYVFDVKKGKYYGHPNPERCEWVLNAGNPTGYTGDPLFKVNAYPAGTKADPNYDLAGVYDAGLHASANGTVEYQNTTAFGGALAGKLLVVRYSANQEIVAFNVNPDGSLSKAIAGITGFTGLRQPLDVAQDVSTGNLYVTELTDNPATTGIKLLKPQGQSSVGRGEATPRLVYTDVKGGAASAAKDVVVKNTGGAPLTVTAATLTGPQAASFARSGGPALPVTIPAGGSATFPVVFNPTAAGPQAAALELTTGSPASPKVSTVLRGLGTDGLGGAAEPSLQWILDTLQIPVNAGDPDPSNNTMPSSSALIGDEVRVEAFTKAAFDHVVEVETLSLFGPAGPGADGNTVTIGAHTAGKLSERTALLEGPNSSNQQVLPVVREIGEYDLETPFGLDFTWPGLSNRVTTSEDALNTWDAAANHKVRVYPLKNADGSLEPNAYVVAPEDVAPPSVDYQDAVVILRNVKPAALSGQGRLTTDKPELVFSGVRGTSSTEQTVKVTNTGSTPLAITGAQLTGTDAAAFTLTGGPVTVPPATTVEYGVRFRPTSASSLGALSAAVRFTSDDASRPTVSVGVFGLATPGEQGNNEPPLKAVVDTLGYPVNVGGTGLILGIDPRPIGDEVPAPLFTKLGTGPVTIKPVARYSPDELLPFGYYTVGTGSPELKGVGTVALDNEQTLNPAVTPDSAGSFDPGTENFGFYVDSKSFGRKTYTQDGLNTNIPHGVRTYPVKDRTGKPVPGTYLVTFEDAQNGDYQDYVFLVGNVRPAGAVTGTPVAKVDFTPTAATVADGYTADTGAPFDATRGFGWVRPGTGTPLDMTAQTRERTGTQDVKVRTVILMQPTAAQSANGPGAWEHVVPNGRYTVTVGVGDTAFTDSVHQVQVEGTTAVAFTPTTASPVRTATVTVDVTDGALTVDALGGTNTKLQYVDINDAAVVADTTAPTVTAAVTGLQQSAGVYKNEASITVTATDAQSGVASLTYSLDNGPFVPWTAAVKVTAGGQHTVRARASDVAGNVATPPTTTFTVVTAGSSTAQVVLENGDGVPFADRLVMNRIQNPERGTTCKTAGCGPTGPFIPANVVHDTATLVVRNTGTEALNVTGLPVTGPFQLVNPAVAPALVPVGGQLQVPVRFTATSGGAANGLWTGTLTVQTDDADEPALPVQLAGFWQSVSEGNQEPDLRETFAAFGYTTAVTAAGVPLNTQGQVRASGDEVLSPYWLRADTTRPVTVRQLAAFHTQGNTATFRWHAKTSGSATGVLTHDGVEGQSFLPHLAGSTAVAQGVFNPAGAFGLQIDGEWSDPTRNNAAVDVANGCLAPCGQHLRTWAVRDRSGTIVRNTWLVAMDYSGINYDYQDNVYLVTNMKPETATDPGAPASLPGAASLRLGFDTAVPGTLVDGDGQGTGFRSTQPNVNDGVTGSSSYDPTRLDLDTAGPGTLAVTSSGTLTNGTNGSNDNTLVNGVRMPFDATSGTWTVRGKVLGPLTAINAGFEQEGIQTGPDQDNFAKMVVVNRGGAPGVEFYAELGGVGQNAVNATAALPAGATSVELFLVGDAATGTLRGAYRVDDGSIALLPTTWTLPAAATGRFFSTQSEAGLLVSNKGGEQFVARFDSFGVVDGDATTPAAERDALYRLDVAGAGRYTDTQGRVWTPDTGRFSPATAVDEGAATGEIAGTEDDVLYRTYRGNVGNVAQADRVLRYSLPSRGVTSVDLRLHFAERASGNNAAGRRVFDISAEGKVLRSGFDVFAAAGALNTATVLTLPNVAVSGGSIDLALAATADYPAVAAIEVLCKGTCPAPDTTAPAAPTGLAATATGSGITLDWADNGEADLAGYDVLRSTSATGTFTKVSPLTVTASGYVDTAVQLGSTYHYKVVALDSSDNVSAPSEAASATTLTPQPIRINTGGPAQTVGGVTWSGCAAVGSCSGWVSGGFAYGENDTNTGLAPGTNNAIYQTEWTGAGNPAFRFAVPVLNGSYQVRLHFAELNKTAPGQRVFDVRLENAAALTGFDLFAQAGGANRAVVRSFPATITDGVVNLDFVSRVENAKISAIEIVPVDTAAPSQVTGVTASASPAGVSLGWAARTEPDLVGYHVYRATSATGSYTKLTTTPLTATTYVDAAAAQGAASYYQVTAVDASGNESARSATAQATRPDTTPPGAVTGLTARGTATGVDLAWTARTEGDLAGYRVYRATSAAGPFTAVAAAPQTGTTYTDTTAVVGQPTYYQVSAVDRSGNESTRAAASGTRTDTTAPAQVAGVTASGAAAGVTVGWTARTEADLAGYHVYRATSATGSYTRLTATAVTATTYVDATAPSGAASYYQVTAVDTSGNESVRSATATATRPDTTAPAQVTGVTATGSTTGVSVGWTARTEADLAGYSVYRATSATGTYTRLTATAVTGTTFVDTTAPVGATSYYQVTATDRSGNESVRSATAQATRPAAGPTTVRINTGGPAQTVGGTTWSACTSVGACSGWVSGGFAYSEADTVSGLPAGTNNTVFQSEWTGGATGAGVVPVGSRAFGFTVPVANGSYRVRLHFAELNKTAAGQRAFDVRLEGTQVLTRFDVFAAAGGIDRAVTRQFSTTVTDGAVTLDFIRQVENAKISAIEILPADTTAPAAVTGLTATAATTGTTLRWTASTATDLARYRVYRAASATGTFTELTTPASTATSFVDTTAPAGVASFYRVTAVDDSGNQSAVSATVQATRPRPTIRINAGGPAQTVGGTTWSACSSTTACSGWVTGGFAYSEADTVTALPAGTNNTVFQSEWTGGATGAGVVPVGSRAFGFAVPVPNGSYRVRLHFAELNKTRAGQRTFDVRLEGTQVLTRFDVFAAAGGIDRAVTREFTANVTDGTVNLDLIRQVENAKISAIEIIPS
ncbi:malectin domain-containing carbohydrate-binding protein [Microlunatus capsulatus]|uniref:malectin domain-containing carbohydrate-binding protein n=1 Tax=Microlunatus capsulatus TaxID=99117 RepID=UPI0031DB3B49